MTHPIKRLALAVALLMAATGVALAETEFSTKATVVSLDAKTRTMTVRSLAEGAKEKPKDYVVRWDDKTAFVKEGATWADEPTKIKVADVTPSTRVYVTISDRFFNFPGQKNDTLWLQTLKVLRPAP